MRTWRRPVISCGTCGRCCCWVVCAVLSSCREVGKPAPKPVQPRHARPPPRRCVDMAHSALSRWHTKNRPINSMRRMIAHVTGVPFAACARAHQVPVASGCCASGAWAECATSCRWGGDMDWGQLSSQISQAVTEHVSRNAGHPPGVQARPSLGLCDRRLSRAMVVSGPHLTAGQLVSRCRHVSRQAAGGNVCHGDGERQLTSPETGA